MPKSHCRGCPPSSISTHIVGPACMREWAGRVQGGQLLGRKKGLGWGGGRLGCACAARILQLAHTACRACPGACLEGTNRLHHHMQLDANGLRHGMRLHVKLLLVDTLAHCGVPLSSRRPHLRSPKTMPKECSSTSPRSRSCARSRQLPTPILAPAWGSGTRTFLAMSMFSFVRGG